MKHDEIQESLASHLRASTDRMVWTNTQLGPSGSPRPDVFSINKSYSKFRSDCYEVKFSVSDLRSDLTSGKWQSYLAYGHAVWFAFRKGLVPIDLIPKSCGVILLNDEGVWRAARKAVPQVLDTLPRNAWLKLLIESVPEASPGMYHRPSRSEYAAQQKVRAIALERMGSDLAKLMADADAAEMNLRHRQATAAAELARLDENYRLQQSRLKEQTAASKERLDGAMLELASALGVADADARPEMLTRAIYEFRGALGMRDVRNAMDSLGKLAGMKRQEDGTWT